MSIFGKARGGGTEVAGWTLDRKIRVRFPAYPHRVWALWLQGGKRRLRTSRCLCRGRLGTLKTPSCPWRGCPAAGQNLETGHLSRHYIAEISLNVTLNHNQQHQHSPFVFGKWCCDGAFAVDNIASIVCGTDGKIINTRTSIGRRKPYSWSHCWGGLLLRSRLQNLQVFHMQWCQLGF